MTKKYLTFTNFGPLNNPILPVQRPKIDGHPRTILRLLLRVRLQMRDVRVFQPEFLLALFALVLFRRMGIFGVAVESLGGRKGQWTLSALELSLARRMRLHVVLQLAPLGKPFLTLCACVRLVVQVHVPVVKVQLRLCVKGLSTPVGAALKVPHVTVPHLVYFQVQLGFKARLADVADDRLLRCVRQHVHLKGLRSIKLFLAHGAGKRLLRAHVHALPVLHHQLGIAEGALAFGTGVFGTGMGERVVAHRQAAVKLLAADVANKGLR